MQAARSPDPEEPHPLSGSNTPAGPRPWALAQEGGLTVASKPQHGRVTAPAPVSSSSTPRGFTSEQKAACKQTQVFLGGPAP